MYMLNYFYFSTAVDHSVWYMDRYLCGSIVLEYNIKCGVIRYSFNSLGSEDLR